MSSRGASPRSTSTTASRHKGSAFFWVTVWSYTIPIKRTWATGGRTPRSTTTRSEEHTSELQSRLHLVCRLLLEKKKKTKNLSTITQHNITSTRVSCQES